jgi:hypothetical protein
MNPSVNCLTMAIICSFLSACAGRQPDTRVTELEERIRELEERLAHRSELLCATALKLRMAGNLDHMASGPLSSAVVAPEFWKEPEEVTWSECLLACSHEQLSTYAGCLLIPAGPERQRCIEGTLQTASGCLDACVQAHRPNPELATKR